MKRSTLSLTQPGWAIFCSIVVLLSGGLACIYVTDTHYAGGRGAVNASKQLIFALAGFIAAAIVLRIGYRAIARRAYLIFAIGLVALIPLLIARLFHTDFGGLTAPRNGAYRWIRLPGFQLQPSEFIKVAYMLTLAWYLQYRKSYRQFKGLMIPIAFSVPPLALVLLEPDLGTVLLMLPVLLAMLFLAGARIRHLLIIMLFGIALAPLAWQYVQPYQKLRVTAVLLQSEPLRQAVIRDPDKYAYLATKRQALEWAASAGYQLVHSKNALGSGGVFGHGWGKGVYVENSLLPDRHNDFIFSMIAHQFGLVGCLLVLGAFVVIVVSGVRIASATKEPFGRLLSVGVVTLLAVQVLIHTGMAVGMLPITGMTLPFVSYGGSSLLTNFVAVALLVSVSQYRPFLLANSPFEYTTRVREPRLGVVQSQRE